MIFLFGTDYSHIIFNLWNGTVLEMRTQSTRHTEQLNADTKLNQFDQLTLSVWDWSENAIRR